MDALTGIVALAVYFNLWSGLASAYPLEPALSQLHLAEAVGAGYIIVVALLRTGMWLWMASKCKSGKRWARFLSTVCFVIESLATILVLTRPVLGGGLQLLMPVAIWLVGVCAVVLLWQGQSSEFFARSPRY